MTKNNQITFMLQDAHREADIRARKLMKCGALNGDEAHYCKAIVYAALHEVAQTYMPFSPEGKADAKNLAKF